LQALFEFQSMVSDLLGLGVVNASMYDASTALAEAALMCRRVTRRKRFVVPRHMAPEKRSTLENYCRRQGIEVLEYGFDSASGRSDVASIRQALDDGTAGVYVENPNFFGVWEPDVAEVAQMVRAKGGLLVAGFDLSSLGLVEGPGALGADIAVGDGTTFCFPPSLGGPQLGIFASREDLARRMPGRIIGASRDSEGARAYCMTLQTREQHIRRDKATSNICTNQSLLAIGTAAHLAALGPEGLKELGVLNAQAAARLARLVEDETSWQRAFSGEHYNEFTLKGPVAGQVVYDRAGAASVTPGYPAARAVRELEDQLVVCTTEIHTTEDHAALVRALREVEA
jgi:glycine dehydrogenase subunit 1